MTGRINQVATGSARAVPATSSTHARHHLRRQVRQLHIRQSLHASRGVGSVSSFFARVRSKKKPTAPGRCCRLPVGAPKYCRRAARSDSAKEQRQQTRDRLPSSTVGCASARPTSGEPDAPAAKPPGPPCAGFHRIRLTSRRALAVGHNRESRA